MSCGCTVLCTFCPWKADRGEAGTGGEIWSEHHDTGRLTLIDSAMVARTCERLDVMSAQLAEKGPLSREFSLVLVSPFVELPINFPYTSFSLCKTDQH